MSKRAAELRKAEIVRVERGKLLESRNIYEELDNEFSPEDINGQT